MSLPSRSFSSNIPVSSQKKAGNQPGVKKCSIPLQTLLFTLLFCFVAEALSTAPNSNGPPVDWAPYLDGLYLEYLEKTQNGDDRYQVKYVQPGIMDFSEDPNSPDPLR